MMLATVFATVTFVVLTTMVFATMMLASVTFVMLATVFATVAFVMLATVMLAVFASTSCRSLMLSGVSDLSLHLLEYMLSLRDCHAKLGGELMERFNHRIFLVEGSSLKCCTDLGSLLSMAQFGGLNNGFEFLDSLL